ncbi:MAG: methyltransferase [Granulosicoccus sp.]
MSNLIKNIESLALKRWPRVDNDRLQAWDAADEYLLNHLQESDGYRVEPGRTLIINDSHGALATALNSLKPVSWSDSYIAHQSAAANVIDNKCEYPFQELASTDTPNGQFDLLLIKIPKTTALLEDQLSRIRPLLHTNTRIVAAGMIKHLQKSAFACLEKMIGPLTTSLAKKKARLLFPVFDSTLSVKSSPYPTIYTDADIPLPMSNHANVFSRDSLDHGARFLMSQYNQLSEATQAVDLACGNGVLGLMYQKRFPTSHMTYIDESYSAIASASMNHATWFSDPKPSASFRVGNGLDKTESDSVELILCNPPFHQQHVVGDQVAMELFREAKCCLRQKGELWIVANQHLGYSGKLKHLYGNCRIVATNKKFAVFKVVKR